MYIFSKVLIKIISCSISVIYNRVNCDKKQYLILLSYIPGITSLVYLKRYSDNFFSGEIFNKLTDYIY